MSDKYQSIFKDEIHTYLSLRRIELSSESFRHEKHAITFFDRYLAQVRLAEKEISLELMGNFIAAFRIGRNENTVMHCLGHIRQFIKYLSRCGYSCSVPEHLPRRDNYTPYLFSDSEFSAIINTADNFSTTKAWKNHYVSVEMPMLIRVLYSCGLRLSEALSLKMRDVDLQCGILTLRITKNRKQRLIPMHHSLTKILSAYCMAIGIVGHPDKAVFPGADEFTPLALNSTRNYFSIILDLAGIKRDGYKRHERGPCLHCLRHGFVVRSFKQAEVKGNKIHDSIPFLSTYLGHKSLYETEKYLKFSGDLFPDSIRKFEAYTADVFPEVQFDA